MRVAVDELLGPQSSGGQNMNMPVEDIRIVISAQDMLINANIPFDSAFIERMKRALQLDVDLIIANDFQGMKIPNIIIT
jgi:hypothetical protein